VPAEFCGYEWPKDCERFDYDDRLFSDEEDSHQQTTCARETLPDTDRCAWHAAPDETEHKSIEALQDARVPAEIRAESKAGESLDGAVLTGMKIESKLNFSGTLFRGADLSDADLDDTDLSGLNLGYVDLSEAFLYKSDLSEADLRYVDLSEASLNEADLSEADLYNADLSGADLDAADLPEADLRSADLLEASFNDADLSEADLRRADLLEASFNDADLSEADLWRADFSEASLNDADLSETSLKNIKLSRTNLTNVDLRDVFISNADISGAIIVNTMINSATSVDGFAKQSSAEGWVKLAGAYHDLKLECHDAGFVGKARQLHISERRARRRETAAEVGWFSRQHLPQFVSGLFTGYGVGVWRLVGTMTALFTISTLTYVLAEVTNPFTYSTITFATSPPRPTGSLPIWARFVANVETFVGTLLIVSLGFVLGNREQF
jgi:uncharacterized protein YjbI with pentapeptide repeats